MNRGRPPSGKVMIGVFPVFNEERFLKALQARDVDNLDDDPSNSPSNSPNSGTTKNKNLVQSIALFEPSVFNLYQLPRISKAQTMDILTSVRNIQGYRSVLEGMKYY